MLVCSVAGKALAALDKKTEPKSDKPAVSFELPTDDPELTHFDTYYINKHPRPHKDKRGMRFLTHPGVRVMPRGVEPPVF